MRKHLESRVKLTPERLRDLLRRLERRQVAERPSRALDVRAVRIDAGHQEGQDADRDLDLRRGAGVNHHPLLDGIGALEQVARPHPDAVASRRAELDEGCRRAEGSDEARSVVIGAVTERICVEQLRVGIGARRRSDRHDQLGLDDRVQARRHLARAQARRSSRGHLRQLSDGVVDPGQRALAAEQLERREERRGDRSAGDRHPDRHEEVARLHAGGVGGLPAALLEHVRR